MNKLEKILRDTPVTDKPSADFSSAVMKRVYAEAEAEAAREATLEQFLRRLPADNASADFTSKVMQKVSASSEPLPLLGLWGRVAIVALAAMWIAGSYFSRSETSFGSIARKFSSLPSLEIPPMYALTVFAMGVLLLLDYALRRTKIPTR